MTPVFCCGFECGQLGAHWASTTGSIAFVSGGTKRSGAASLRANPTAGTATIASTGLSLYAASPIVGRVYIYFQTLPNANCALVYILDAVAAGYDGVYFKASDSSIYAGAFSSGIVFGATGIPVTTGIWYCVDFRSDANANPRLTDVKVDGNSCAQLSRSVTARNNGEVRLGVALLNATADIYFDDIITTRVGADYPIGAGYVNHFVPTSDGTHNVAGTADFRRGTTITDILNSTTDSYLLVDDVPLDDTTPDTDDFIACIAPANSTDYTENKFGPAPGIATPTTGPRAVDVCYAHHEAGTGSCVYAAKLNDNGTVADIHNPGAAAGATSTRYARAQFAVMPKDSAAWTAARFNDLRIRFGYSSDANPDGYFDCAMIEAEFAQAATAGASVAWIGA